jgi:hypothetical protein
MRTAKKLIMFPLGISASEGFYCLGINATKLIDVQSKKLLNKIIIVEIAIIKT